jgi:asparagine synthase (glutamine-hydrolysing)
MIESTAPGSATGESVPSELKDAASEVRRRVSVAVSSHPAECLLLSGGLDTSILAPLAARHGTRAAVTVLAAPDAPDRPFATRIASDLGWTHRVIESDLDELLGEVDFVVRQLRTFDPMEVRNSIVIARALREAARAGYRTAMTGDAADELFGGYSFMWSRPDGEFEEYSRRLAATMHFSSTPLGRALGVEVRAPYRDPEVVALAVSLPKRWKVGLRDGVPVGKWILRWAFPEAHAVWRRKDPIEVGSGTTQLPRRFSAMIPPEDFRSERERIAREDRVDIRDAEHLAYYRAFRRAFGNSPPRARFADNPCAHCGFELRDSDATFCTTCGAYPAR